MKSTIALASWTHSPFLVAVTPMQLIITIICRVQTSYMNGTLDCVQAKYSAAAARARPPHIVAPVLPDGGEMEESDRKEGKEQREREGND